ncbi:hypothetical protein [Methylopila sp. M107]|uniref:hypothetical protein n=1 Tax=Methylopila sp. M107 TaxID=1101190 RepID=UPI001FD91821|nr:hypothetical protein [Methylopila sp. M107]
MRDVAEAAGLDAALALARAAGGRRVSIPARAKDGHWLVQAVGREAADRICAHFRTLDPDDRERGARQIVVPVGPEGVMERAKRQLREKLASGMAPRQAAREAGLHERTAWYAKARMRAATEPDPTRPTLFEAGLEQPSKPVRKRSRG